MVIMKFTTYDNKPDLVATVAAELPEEVFMESSNKPSLTISSSTKHKWEKESEIADAISGLWTSHIEVELSKWKMDLIQHQEERWAAENFFRQQDEVHKATEHLFKQPE